MFVAMIELTNPSGVCKVMTPDEYVELLNKYVTTKFFKAWSDRRNIAGMIKLTEAILIGAGIAVGVSVSLAVLRPLLGVAA